MNKYKKNDILISPDGNKRKVLEVLGDLVFMSYTDEFEEHSDTAHYKEIDKNYTVEQEKYIPQEYEMYWTMGLDVGVYESTWYNVEVDQQMLALNLVFKTKEEALARYEEIINLIK